MNIMATNIVLKHGELDTLQSVTPKDGTLYVAKRNDDATAELHVDLDSTRYKITELPVTTSADGLMTSSDKIKLNYTNIAWGTCSTAAGTAAKTITLSGNNKWALTAGSIVVILFSNTNTANNPTFNVNGTGAKSVYYQNAIISTSSLNYGGYKNRPMIFIYDGNYYRFAAWGYDSNTTYTNVSLGNGYATQNDAAATGTITAALSSFKLLDNGFVSVKFKYDVPEGATLNINSTGARNILHKGTNILGGTIKAGDTATFVYDGSSSSGNFHLIAIDRNLSYTLNLTGDATGSASIDGSNNVNLAVTIDGSKHDHTISAGAEDDDVVILAGTEGSNAVSYKATHAKKGPSTSGSTTKGATADLTVDAFGESGTIKVPKVTADAYGHVTGLTEQTLTIGLPTIPAPTKLASAKTIDGVDFDGSANIHHFGTCAIAADTTAKTVQIAGFKLATGARVTVQFTYANTVAKPTLNVSATGAKSIYWHNAALPSSQYWQAGAVLDFVYDGAQWELIGVAKDNNTTYTSLKNPNAVTITGNGTQGISYDGSAAKTLDFVGGGATTVSAEAGKITITSTDTNTKVTSAANHYTPAVDANSAISAPATGATTSAAWDSTNLVTGVNLSRDSKGHVTGISVTSVKMPANPDTNTEYTGDKGIAVAGTVIKHTNAVTAAQATNTTGTVDFGGSIKIPTVGYDAQGHIVGIGENSVTLPSKPTYDLTATQASGANPKINLVGGGSASGTDSVEIKPGSNISVSAASNAITISATDTKYTAGNGITIGTDNKISHKDTSSQGNVTANGRRYITGVTLDTYGHVTGLTTGTETVVDTNTTYTAGAGLSLDGTEFNHSNSVEAVTAEDVSATASFGSSIEIPLVSYDTEGHITGTATKTITLPAKPTDKDTTYSISTSKASGANAKINLTAGGSGSGTDSIEIKAGSNISTSVSGDVLTISATDTKYTSGNAITVGSDKTISHNDTSNQSSLVASDRTYVTGITLDDYGHITGLQTGTETVVNTDTTYSAGTGLSLSGTTFNHSNSITGGTAKGSSGSVAHGGSITIPSITYDAQGHITGTTTTSVTLPTDKNTTYSISASKATTSGANAKINLTAGGSGSGTDSIEIKEGSNIQTSVSGDVITISATDTTYTAGDGIALSGTEFSHGDTSSQASLVANGRKYVTGVTLDEYGHVTGLTTGTESVTDTHHKTAIRAGASGTNSNSAATDPYVKVLDNTTYRSQIQLKGSGATTVASDANGVITISSTDNNTTYTAGTGITIANNVISSTVTAASLGLTSAMIFIGTTTTELTDGATTNPITIGGASKTATNGNVVLYGEKEFIWNGSAWEEIGSEGSHALKTTKVTAGDGLTGGGTLGSDITISHKDTSSQSSISASGRRYITGVTLDTYGHVTGLSTGTETVTDTNTTYSISTSKASNANAKINLTAGGSGSGTDSIEIAAGSNVQTSVSGDVLTISATDTKYTSGNGITVGTDNKISHNDTSSQASVKANGRKYITGVTLDGYGHVTGLTTGTETVTDTNTTYTLSAPASQTNGNVTLKLDASSGTDSSVSVKGSGATTVTTDANGVITVSSTDTNTKVTSVGNHYTPSADANAALSVDASSTTSATWGSTSLVTGVNLQRDAKGHITGVTVDSIRMPSNPNTDTKYTPEKLGFGYATCSTAAATAAKVASLTNYELVKNGNVEVKFTYAVPANATLNINSKGAKNIYFRGAKITADVIKAGDTATFIYDGTQYQLISIDRWQNDIANLQTDVDEHINYTNNPHQVTLAQLGVTAIAAELNKLDGVTATTAELNYVDGVTSNIQTQLNNKVPTSRRINGIPLTSDFTLDAQSIGVYSNATIDTKLAGKASTAVATTSAAGLMSAADKTKLNNTNVAYGTCSTAAATAEKAVTLSGNTK